MPASARIDACARCRAEPPVWRSAAAPLRYEGVARDVLLGFKLGGERRAADAIAAWMARCAPPGDVMTAVPSTRRSVVTRGFDPAGMLASALGDLLDRPVVPLLRKTRETQDQAGLDARARRRNLAGAFAPARRMTGARVLLVDDVMTTGATAEACGRALLAGGAAEVGVLTAARAG